MTEKIFHASAGMGRKLQGQALVAKDGFSARYDLDRIKGVFSRPEHKLAGESYVGRVLVLDAAKGGVATAWMLYEMQARGVIPAALVLNAVNPIMVQGVALADFTMISGFDCDITQAIPNGAQSRSTRPPSGRSFGCCDHTTLSRNSAPTAKPAAAQIEIAIRVRSRTGRNSMASTRNPSAMCSASVTTMPPSKNLISGVLVTLMNLS